MKVTFYYSDKTFCNSCHMDYIPCVGDHVDIHHTEHIVIGRLFNTYGIDEIKLFVKKATHNDVTFMN